MRGGLRACEPREDATSARQLWRGGFQGAGAAAACRRGGGGRGRRGRSGGNGVAEKGVGGAGGKRQKQRGMDISVELWLV